jgi:bloom syndrome protein
MMRQKRVPKHFSKWLAMRQPKKNNYYSNKTRCDLRALFSERFGSGAEPYQWQLDVTEAILLGLDIFVIAGC